MAYFPNLCECKCLPCHFSLKEGVSISLVAFLILGASIGCALGTHYLSQWTLKSSLLVGGAVVIGGLTLEVALVAIFKQKKEKREPAPEIKEEEIKSEEPTPLLPPKVWTCGSISIENVTKGKFYDVPRRIFKVTDEESHKVYYIKLGRWTDTPKVGQSHPLNDWLAYKIATFLNVASVPQCWYFGNLKKLEASSEFSLKIKEALLNHPEIKEIHGPFVIQVGVELNLPASGESEFYRENIKIEKQSAHEALLFSLLVGHPMVKLSDAPVDQSQKIQLVDNDNIGQEFDTSLNYWNIWLKDHVTFQQPFEDEVRDKFEQIDKSALESHLKKIKEDLKAQQVYVDSEFISNILANLDELKRALENSKTPNNLINKFGKG